ncbi:SH3 domain-containing protein [Streptomyces sp. NPDC004838]
MRRTRTRTRALAAVLPLVATAGLMTAATPAQAGTSGARGCLNHQWSNRDSSAGHVTSSSPLHIGPHGYCLVKETLNVFQVLQYHCSVMNESGNGWTHVRITGTDITGWVYDGHLNNWGSNVRC